MRALYFTLTRRSLAMVAFETVLILAAVAVAARITTGDAALTVLTIENGLAKGALIALVCQTVLYYSDLYDFRTMSDRRELFINIVQALGAASFILALIYF